VLRHDCLHHIGVADVELCRGRPNLAGQIGCSGDIEIGDHNVSTSIGKASHDRRTNALRTARDEGAAAIEPPERPGAGRRH
jgi:hypothetical protein